MPDRIVTLSIRTLTVGPGITPDLLSFEFDSKRSRAFNQVDLPPVGNFARPENKRIHYNAND